MDIVTDENVEKIMKERGAKQTELDVLKSNIAEKMWLGELLELRDAYCKFAEKPKVPSEEKVVKKKKTSKK